MEKIALDGAASSATDGGIGSRWRKLLQVEKYLWIKGLTLGGIAGRGACSG